jgi:hypothetical protein
MHDSWDALWSCPIYRAELATRDSRGKEEHPMKKISIRKAGAVKLTGAMRPLYGTTCVA